MLRNDSIFGVMRSNNTSTHTFKTTIIIIVMVQIYNLISFRLPILRIPLKKVRASKFQEFYKAVCNQGDVDSRKQQKINIISVL